MNATVKKQVEEKLEKAHALMTEARIMMTCKHPQVEKQLMNVFTPRQRLKCMECGAWVEP